MAPASAERPERVGSWPYLTVVRDAAGAPDAPGLAARPGLTDADQAFWGPNPPPQLRPASTSPASDSPARAPAASDRPARDSAASDSAASASTTGDSAGKDQGTGSNNRTGDRKRPGPRHAAPSAGFGATLGRRLASPRLTSRSAAHAG